MLGLMQDTPLTVESILRRGEQYFPTRSRRDEDGHRHRPGHDRRPRRQSPPGGRRARHARPVARRPGRLVRLEHRPPPRALLRRARAAAGSCTRSTSGTSPTRSSTSINHAEDEAIFVDRSLLPLFAKYLGSIDTVKHIIVMDDGADGRDSRRSAHRHCGPTSSTAADRGSTSPTGSATRTPRPRSATRPARPATPRACCIPTARSGCTRYAGTSTSSLALTNATTCCRWCRCSTRWPGGCPTPR